MHERNPYAPPSAAVQDIAVPDVPRGLDATFVPYGRRRPATSGVEWIVTGWYIFKQRPGLWILTVFVAYAIFIALSLVPFLNLAVAVCSPLLTAGFAAMAHAGYRGERYGFAHVAAGFQRHTAALLLVGLIALGVPAAATVLLVLLDDPVWLQIAMGSADPQAIEGRIVALLGYSLTVSAVGMLLMFAPMLAFLNGLAPFEAVKMSAVGFVKNLLPGLLCAAALFGLFIVSILTLGLGLLVTFPLLFITLYAAYRDIFLAPAGDAPGLA